ncbi:MAG: PDZ domain-containing protein [Desulfobulbaceae bacterium]|nr:PDZ domain-containing protein [Desulfobulbaceae bacterium]
MIMTILLAYTSWADFSRTRDSTKVVQISESSKNKEIGISLNPTQSNPTQIVAVFLNSPAEKSGLKNGDIIISIEGTEVSSRDEIVGFINTSDNPALDFVVKRNNENVSISVWRLP